MLQHLQLIWEKSGVCPALIANAPKLPDGCDQLWHDFLELHDSRGSTGFGPMRITFSDLHAWQTMRGLRLQGWELDAIRRADNAWLKDYGERQKKEKP